MRRADRLFRILDMMRGGRVVTAAAIASELEVSPRTVYRDVQTLIGSSVPIQGEAGVGYCLRHGFELPPLMFDADEISALVLGARMVEAWGDATLSRRARSVLSKVEGVIPDRLKPALTEFGLFVPMRLKDEVRANVDRFRRGVNERRKCRFCYVDENGEETERTVRPVCLAFWGYSWTATAWCELRDDFRSFRPDRMREVELLDGTFKPEKGKDLDAFLERMHAEHEHCEHRRVDDEASRRGDSSRRPIASGQRVAR